MISGLRLLAVCIVILAAAISLRAQEPVEETDRVPEIVHELGSEIGNAAFGFWTPRLGGYKSRIDQVLAPDDLAELNRLRVRWVIILDEGLRPTVRVRHGDTAAVQIDGRAIGRMTELMEVHAGALALAARYRSELEGMHMQVLDDIAWFTTEMADRSDRFVEANRPSFESDPAAARVLERRGDLRKAAEDLGTERGRKGLASIYALVIEPIVLLYDGTDLKAMLDGGLPSRISIGGIELPENSLLAQNAPNPAATSTTISYTLSTRSSQTKLEVFNATGVLVAELDQGERDEGEHRIALDVSSFPSGSYVYRLTARAEGGAQVSSRVMRVVH